MPLHPLFRLREKHTDALLDLLNEAVLGTNGAHYKHLDKSERIEEMDNPLHLSMERNDKVIGNLTFCRRNHEWYIRYFAFSTMIQSGGQKKSNAKKTNLLRRELINFFEEAFQGEYGEEVNSFYAYIDPNNEKSLWMSENFGFETIAHVATQTFSRVRPKSSKRVQRLEEVTTDVQQLVRKNFSHYRYYFEQQTFKPPVYIIRDKGEIVAMAKINTARWEIKRLPGKMGGVLTKVIPFIPGLNKIIRPKDHVFIVPEAVYVKDDNVALQTELFEGILANECRNLMIWWVDEKDTLYSAVKSTMKWGILNRLVGVNRANVVSKSSSINATKETPVYTAGIDFI